MRIWCAASVAAAFVAVAAAQQAPFRSGANYVRVDVYPTAAGKPVDDLTAADFQVFEDGRPQSIDSVEYVSSAAPWSGQRARQADGRHARRFILFLDTVHVSSTASVKVGEPLIRFLDRLIADGDLVGVMTPDMTTALLQLGSKTDVLARALRDHPTWGRRDDRTLFDETEQRYVACYPMLPNETANGRTISELAQNLIERRRERRALDALNDLVTYSGGLGDTRKTIIAVTEGWRLFGSDQQLLEPRRVSPDDPRTEEPPGRPGISVGRDGKLTTDDPTSLRSLRYPCEADRLRFASVDDKQYLRDIIGDANRRNTSFYTIDPRGLAVFDASIQWDRPAREALPLRYDGANLSASHSSMRMLAVDTDGMAVLDSNDVSGGLDRIARDLASYYLLAYYSTNARLDGKFREITIHVTRSGVHVRARRGYRAPTSAELASASAPAVAADPRAGVTAALAELDIQLLRNSVPVGPVRLFRRGPLTGNQLVPATSLMFSRTDRLRFERRLDAGAASEGTARILDRNGQVLPIPLTIASRTDDDGRRWVTTDVSLAPLGAGDYVIEIDAAGEKTLTAIRIGR
jgi:VWFA-related protein